MATETIEKPLRVAVFGDIRRADEAVRGLLAAGFTKDQITVITSDKHREGYFSEYMHQLPAGAKTPEAVTAGTTIGTVLGGLAALAGAVTTGGVGLLFAGVALIPAGAVVGGFVGAMLTQGIEKELAYYYDQAVSKGKILVAAGHHGPNPEQMLEMAEQIFERAGAEPVELPEG
jgi:hypothetical protein